MSRKIERKRIEILTKRRDFLAARIIQRRAEKKETTHDDAERSALTWALEMIAGALKSGVRPEHLEEGLEDDNRGNRDDTDDSHAGLRGLRPFAERRARTNAPS
jgi:hypothetical protein